MKLAGWQLQTGQDKHSIVADPKFFDAARDDFRLADNSPALSLGFRVFDLSTAGCTNRRRHTANLPPIPPGFQ